MHHKFINRDLSWLEFNRRVLEEAQNEQTPLMERVKFLSIFSTNLDEFMSVRVAGIRNRVKNGSLEPDFSGYTPEQLLNRIIQTTETMVADQYAAYRQVLSELDSIGFGFKSFAELTDEQKRIANDFISDKVLPNLKPAMLNNGETISKLRAKRLHYMIVLMPHDRSLDKPAFAIMEFLSPAGRFMEIPPTADGHKGAFLLIDQLIKSYIPALFPQWTVAGAHLFRIIRDADLPLDEEHADDLLHEVESKLPRRLRGAPVRLEVERDIHPAAFERLRGLFDLGSNTALIDGPLDLCFLMNFSNALPEFERLKYAKSKPMYPKEFKNKPFFDVLKQRDVAMFHPYESFEAFDDFIHGAATDPSVGSISMTLYRVSKQSRIVRALVQAAESGKRVTVVVELKARFDEERNIAWAKKLEQAGCHVIYGWIELKIHAKMTLIERREADKTMRYAHVSTGNYNGQSAKLYTDIGLFTSHSEITKDIAELFEELRGLRQHRKSSVLAVSPTDLRSTLYGLIEREKEHAAAGKPARIIGKMNSLSDPDMIDRLYEASIAGVRIDLIVRGICCLRPGVPGQSENITVRSIVDRYLEHSRVFYFDNNADPEVWLSSADWMTRNLSRRIELMCPVKDPVIRQTIIKLLKLQIEDNVKARVMLPDGTYRTAKDKLVSVRSQYMALPLIRQKYASSVFLYRMLTFQVPEKSNT